MSLVRPPRKSESHFFGSLSRFVMSVIVLAVVAVFGWAIFTNNKIDRSERVDATVLAPGRIVFIPTAGDIHVREEGSGASRVLFIHDFDIAGGYQWLDVADGLSSRSFLIPDMIDFGFSARPTDPGRIHTVVGRSEALVSLLDLLNISRVSIVGAGYGGKVAAEFAASNPELVDRLVLITPEIYGPKPTWESYLYSFPILGDAMNFTFVGAGSQAEDRYKAGCDNDGYCPDADAIGTRRQAAEVRGTAKALTAMAKTPEASTLPESLSSITAPTLILWGDGDSVTPMDQGEQINAAIQGSQFSIVPGTGHRPHLEDPAAVARLIDDFLRS